MSPLSLCQPLPRLVFAEGRWWRVRPDVFTVLRVARMLSDADLAPWHRAELLAQWFYETDVPRDPLTPFLMFASLGTGSDSRAPDFDYEQDAPELVSSFQQLYGINLLDEAKRLHWKRFQALLTGCFAADCALSAKLRLRHTRPEDAPDPDVRRAIEQVQLADARSDADRLMAHRVTERLLRGEGFADLLPADG